MITSAGMGLSLRIGAGRRLGCWSIWFWCFCWVWPWRTLGFRFVFRPGFLFWRWLGAGQIMLKNHVFGVAHQNMGIKSHTMCFRYFYRCLSYWIPGHFWISWTSSRVDFQQSQSHLATSLEHWRMRKPSTFKKWLGPDGRERWFPKYSTAGYCIPLIFFRSPAFPLGPRGLGWITIGWSTRPLDP